MALRSRPEPPTRARGLVGPDSENHIEVFVRCRPSSAREARQARQESTGHDVANKTEPVLDAKSVSIDHRGSLRKYAFDHVFDARATQEEVYDRAAQPLVDEFINGKNCTLFAYGQTGSGKTHTITGDVSVRDPLPPMAGITPRVLQACFAALAKAKKDYSFTFQYVELYNEEFYDLLDTNPLRSTVKLHEQGTPWPSASRRSVVLKGARTRTAASWESALTEIHSASSRRRTANTRLNSNSSRSFSILTLNLMVDNGNNALFASKFHIVDLAGSENIARSGAREQRAQEAGQINRTLLTLGRVIQKLYEMEGDTHRNSRGSTPPVGAHGERIPYRDSKLTRLLEDSLGGATRTCMIAAISPRREDSEETISTLNYAKQARCIRNHAQLVPETIPRDATMRDLAVQLEQAQQELATQRRRDGCVHLKLTQHEQMMSDLQSQRTKIDVYVARHAELEHQLNLSQSRERQRIQEAEQMRLAHSSLERDMNAVKAKVEDYERIETVSAGLNLEIHKAITALQSCAESNLSECTSLGSSLRAELQQIAAEASSKLPSDVADLNGAFDKHLSEESSKLRRKCRIEVAQALELAEDRIRDHLSRAAHTWKDAYDAIRAPLAQAAVVSSQLQNITSDLVSNADALNKELGARQDAARRSWQAELRRTEQEQILLSELSKILEQRRSDLSSQEPAPISTLSRVQSNIQSLSEASTGLRSVSTDARPRTPQDMLQAIPDLDLKLQIPATVDQALIDMQKAALATASRATAIARGSEHYSRTVVESISASLDQSAHVAAVESTSQGIINQTQAISSLLASKPRQVASSPTNIAVDAPNSMTSLPRVINARPSTAALTDIGNRLNLSPRKPSGRISKSTVTSGRGTTIISRRMPH